MAEQKIKCPHCGKDIEVTEVLTHQIRASMKAEVDAELGKREQEFARQQAVIKQKEKELLAAGEALDEKVNEKLRAERLKLVEQKKELDYQKLQIEEQVAAKLTAERKKLTEDALKKAKEEVAGETKAIATELAEQKAKLAEANRKELEFLKQKRELEEQKANMELELARKMEQERKQIEDKALQKAIEAQSLKGREKDDKIEMLTRQINELQRKAEQGSQEAQGEALEGNLKDQLSQVFTFDVFEDVKKGARGADIVQKVRNTNLRECGVILWEAKNAQHFSREWLTKLKSDQQEAGAEVAVLATVTLPKEIDKFGMIDDVWVTDYKNAVCLSMALRHGLIGVMREKLIAANQDTVKDVVYRYVTGQEFSMQVKSMVTAFRRMQEDLDSEKRWMQRSWKSREKQLETVLGGVVNIWGAIEGYAGQKELPGIDPLMLEEG